MKQRFLNQKLGKRPSYRTRLLKAAKPATSRRRGFGKSEGASTAPADTGKRAGTR